MYALFCPVMLCSVVFVEGARRDTRDTRGSSGHLGVWRPRYAGWGWPGGLFLKSNNPSLSGGENTGPGEGLPTSGGRRCRKNATSDLWGGGGSSGGLSDLTLQQSARRSAESSRPESLEEETLIPTATPQNE